MYTPRVTKNSRRQFRVIRDCAELAKEAKLHTDEVLLNTN